MKTRTITCKFHTGTFNEKVPAELTDIEAVNHICKMYELDADLFRLASDGNYEMADGIRIIVVESDIEQDSDDDWEW